MHVARLPLFACWILLLLGLGCAEDGWNPLEDLDELREVFNRDRGKARIVLLLSPT